MIKHLINIYHYFKSHKIILWATLIVSTIIMALISIQLDFKSDITDFLPKQNTDQSLIFKNLKAKDKLIVDINAIKDNVDPNVLIEASQLFEKALFLKIDSSYVNNFSINVDENTYKYTLDYIFDNLPLFVSPNDYNRIDSIMNVENGIDNIIKENYQSLISATNFGQSDLILSDPLHLTESALNELQKLNTYNNIVIYNNYLFSDDFQNIYFFINSSDGGSASPQNKKLIDAIESSFNEVEAHFPDIKFFYYGAPAVATYNAKQIQQDLMITLNIALIVILIIVLLTFKKKRSLILIVLPVVYGVLFSLTCIYFIKGTISSIAIGTGSIVLGIAMSYAIHALSTTFNCRTVEQALSEIAIPLTIGSFTTIGAFFALIFTTSPLLGDFGLFASLSLIGTTIFCLIFLPHFTKYDKQTINNFEKSFWYKINKYNFESNKIIIVLILCVTIFALFNYNKVEFDYDMLHLNYEPQHLKEGLAHIQQMSDDDLSTLTISSSDKNDDAIKKYKATYDSLKILSNNNKVNKFSSAARFIYNTEEQQTKLKTWNTFWTNTRINKLESSIIKCAQGFGFKDNSFDNFFSILRKEYTIKDLTQELISKPNIISNFIETNDDKILLLSQVWLRPNNESEAYSSLSNTSTIIDRSFYISMIAKSISEDFDFILIVSSLLIFIVLYLSYGRLELTLLAFTPMCLSWIIIIGLMPLLGIKFNIINIILSTFIFGIGDDFSIFVLDGLTAKYKNGRSTIIAHKSAILLSALVTIIGMAALIFAKHPAIHSLSLVSLLGISVVVIISYTLQPFLYNLFILNPAKKHLQPITIRSIIRSSLPFTTFFVACVIIQIIILPIIILPLSKKLRQKIIKSLIRYGCIATLAMDFSLKKKLPKKIILGEPSIIIANHQSFIDILVLLSVIPNSIIISKSWVWKSPVFGFIIRQAGFIYSNEGLESILNKAKTQIVNGSSIIIFPEGSRSSDLSINRFHKGAFMLAHKLKVNIVPIALYGNGYTLNKEQTFILRRGITSCKIMSTLFYDSEWDKNNYQEITNTARTTIQIGYNELKNQFNNAQNPYFKDKLRYNYTFKDLVTEQYMNIKLYIEKYYHSYNTLIPKNAKIYDLGCGYGPLAVMLAMLSPKRDVVGIDYDKDKIDLIAHSSLISENVKFVHENVLKYKYENADVFIINDMLHYVTTEEQKAIIKNCANLLNNNGTIIIRDGNSSCKSHYMTKFTEIISTKILNFNKSNNSLNFISRQSLQEIADNLHLSLSVFNRQKGTSNTTYILKKYEKGN